MEVIKVKQLDGGEFVVAPDYFGQFDIAGITRRAGGSCFTELVEMTVEEYKAARAAAGDPVMTGKRCPDCKVETIILTADTELCEECGARWGTLVTVHL